MKTLIIIGILVILIVIVWMSIDQAKATGRKGRLRNRPVVTEDEWYANYGMGLPRDAAFEVVTRLSRLIGCLPVQIYPADRFEFELSLAPGGKELVDSDEALSLFETIDLCELVHDPVNLGKFQTVADVIRMIS